MPKSDGGLSQGQAGSSYAPTEDDPWPQAPEKTRTAGHQAHQQSHQEKPPHTHQASEQERGWDVGRTWRHWDGAATVEPVVLS